MPSKLKNLTVHEGSLVDGPSNPRAFVKLFKRGGDNGMGETMKTDGGKEYPASAYAYVPDLDEPSTWKLRLWETPEDKETAKQVGAAVAALGKGYRGNKVEIPEDDLLKVKEKVLAAWKKTHPDAEEDEIPEVLKKRGRISKMQRILKSWFAGEGWDWDGDQNKTAHSFSDALLDDDYSDGILSVLGGALLDTIDSILDDETVEDKNGAINEALNDFNTRLQAVGVMKHGRSGGNSKGKGVDPVTIDKSQLSPELQAHLEALEKRATEAEAQVAELTKSASTDPKEAIYKGMSPEARAHFEALEKRAQEAEEIAKRVRDESVTREFVAKAASYQALGVNPEEFGPVLKSLSEANPEAYAKIDAVLKGADEAIAKTGLFKEIGKSGGSGSTGGAYEQLEAIAKSKREADPSLSKAAAFNQAVEENPNLYNQYREEM